MMGQASQETGIFPWTKGADFSGPLAVLAPPRENGISVGMSNFYVVCKGNDDGAIASVPFFRKGVVGKPVGVRVPPSAPWQFKKGFRPDAGVPFLENRESG